MNVSVADSFQVQQSTAQVGQWSLVWRRFRRHRRGRISLVAFLLLALFLLAGPLITPFDHTSQELPTRWLAPAGTVGDAGRIHFLGTDDVGRDVLDRLLIGGQSSLAIALSAAFLATLLGVLIGSIAGFYGGWVDAILMRFTDFLLSIPVLPLYVVALPAVHSMINPPKPRGAGQLYDSSYEPAIFLIGTMAIVFTMFGWMGICRLMRGSILSLRSQTFVEASQALGVSNRRLIFKHLIPNSLAPILVATTFAVGDFMAWEAILDYVGLGIDQALLPTWGNLVAISQGYVFRLALLDLNPFSDIRVYLAVFPAILIFITILLLNFIAEALRDALDPGTTI